MKFNELSKNIQTGLLKDSRKSLVVSNIVVCAFFLILSAVLFFIGHGFWIFALFTGLMALFSFANLFMELKSPKENSMENLIKSADYSLKSPSASESN